MEVLLDELVENADDVKKLGIMTGDIVCFDPRTVVTPSGYIKSRFLDDKLSTAILLGYARYLKDENITPARTIYQHITVFEEVDTGPALPFLKVSRSCFPWIWAAWEKAFLHGASGFHLLQGQPRTVSL